MAYRPAQMDIGAILNAGKAVSGSFGSIRENELANAKLAEEQRRYDEQRAWKLEDRDRVAKERQAEDAYYGELAKGVQTKGGIYGDALATEANKYALNPEETLKAALYKNDAEQARVAGDIAIADKLDWQTKVSGGVSPFMQSGVGEESRVEMYDRINSMVGSQGLPVPKEAIISADQARLAERTAEENELKRLKEAKAAILKNDQTNAWKYVNSLGNSSTVVDADGNEVQVQTGPSASVQNRSNTSFNNAVDDGLTGILKTIDDKAKGTESTSKAVVSDQALNLYTTLIRDQGLSPDVASKLVSSSVGSSESGWKELWLGDPKAKLTKDQISTLLPSAMAAMELKKDLVGGTTTTGKGTSKQEASADLISALNMQNKSQLGSILSDQANLAKGVEGRRDDKVTAWLQDQGLVDRPKLDTSKETTIGATDKPLEAKINKNIKSIAGIPDSMVVSEGVTNTSYKDGKGYSIAMGYNLAANRDAVDKDFKDANISPEKAFIAKTRPQDLVLDDGEAQRLSQVAYYKYADSLDKNLGGKLDTLSPQMQATALQMHYRGDLFNKADYAKELRKYVTTNDYDGLVKYVSENADSLPAPVVRRLENDLGAPVTEAIKGKITKGIEVPPVTKESSKSVKELFGESPVISEYKNKRDAQDKEISSSVYARTFGSKTEPGKYAKVWEESDSKKGSTLNKNISSLATAMSKDGIKTYEDVATLYNSMPKGPDRDAVGEVLNYKGMQNSQEWRDAKAKEQYLEAGLTALSAIPGGGKFVKDVAAQPIKNAIRDRAEKAVIKKVLFDPTLAGAARKEATKSIMNNTKVKQDQIKGFINSSSKELENIRKQVLAAKNPSKDLIRKQDELADYISRAKRDLAEIDTDLSTLLNATK